MDGARESVVVEGAKDDVVERARDIVMVVGVMEGVEGEREGVVVKGAREGVVEGAKEGVAWQLCDEVKM